MANNPFSDISTNYVRSPLGIIALFIVLVYAMAGTVTIFAELPEKHLWAITGFLVGFPCLVLAVFYRLVTGFPDIIYGPADFSSDDNFLRYRGRAATDEGADDPADLLRAFWRPDGGPINTENNNRLKQWLRDEDLPTLAIPVFLTSANMADSRARAVRDLGIM